MVRAPSVTRRELIMYVVCGLFSLALLPACGAANAPVESDQLKSLSLEQLGNLEVTSVSKEPEGVWQTPAAIYVLTEDDIRRSGVLTLPDLLRTVPGVEVAELESNQWAVGIRGFGNAFSRNVLLLIDGRSTYTPLFEGVYWDAQDVLLEDIERIEIIRGPGGTVWGANAVNGVINIITKHARDTQGVLATGASGHVDRFNGSVRAGLERGANLQFRLFAKGFVREDEQNAGYDPYDRWHMAHGGFRADWTPQTSNAFTAQGDLYTGASGQKLTIGSYAPLAQLVVDDVFTISGGDLMLKWERSYKGGSDFHLNAYFDRTNRQGTQFGETRNAFDFDFINHLTVLPRQDAIWGAGARFSPDYIIQTQPTVDFEPHAQTDYIYSAFLQDAIHLLPESLTLTVGSKFQDNNYTGFEIQPNARLLWNPAHDVALWASMSRAVRTPGRLDQDLQLTYVTSTKPAVLARIEGSPNFRSEHLLGFEAGYRQLLRRSLFVDLALFQNRYSGLESYGARTISTVSTPIAATLVTLPYVNGIDGETDGLEIAPDWKPSGWWELKGNFSHVHIEAMPRPGFSDTATAASYTGSSPHREATLETEFNPSPRVEFDFDYRFVSRLPSQNVESYQTMDSHIGWMPAKSVRLAVNGRNLLQPHHHEYAGDNLLPVGIRRSIYGEITWTR